jgi:hypothetical protein
MERRPHPRLKEQSQMRSTKTGLTTLALVAFALAACDDTGFSPNPDGGGGGQTTATAEGAYGGTFTGANVATYRMLLSATDHGTDLWTAYGIQDQIAGFKASGLFQASGSLISNIYTGTTAFQYTALAAAQVGTASAVYNDISVPPLLGGAFTFNSTGTNFSGGPIINATFDYATPASLSRVGGSWSVTDLSGNSHALVVSAADGTFTLDAGGACAATGLFSASASHNFYTDEITFGAGAGCDTSLQGKTLRGVAFAYTSSIPVGTQLIAMFHDNTGHTVGYVLNGVK